MRKSRLGLFLALVLGLSGEVLASEPGIAESPQRDALLKEVRAWATRPVVLIMLRAQNARNEGIDQAEIKRLDEQWRAEIKADRQPLIGPVLSNPLSSYLTRLQARSRGLYLELFVMDSHGLNVGQSSITSDYWQGDEAKFQKSFEVGADAVEYGDVEVDEATGTARQQVSLTIVDPETAKPIGAVTVEIDLAELAEWSAMAKQASK